MADDDPWRCHDVDAGGGARHGGSPIYYARDNGDSRCHGESNPNGCRRRRVVGADDPQCWCDRNARQRQSKPYVRNGAAGRFTNANTHRNGRGSDHHGQHKCGQYNDAYTDCARHCCRSYEHTV